MIPYRNWRMIGRLLIISILIWKATTLLFAAIATKILPLQLAFTIWRDPQYKNFGFSLPYLANIWGNFDGFFYMAIARDGYLSGEQPFFPLYPLIMRFVAARFNLPYVLAGQIVSLTALVGALIVVAKLLTIDKRPSLFRWMMVAILTYPTSYSYGAVYNDATFFFFATLSIYLGRTGRFVWAGLAGACATLTRLNGLALLPFLLVEYATSSDAKVGAWNWMTLRQEIRRRLRIHEMLAIGLWGAALIPLALIAYFLWVQGQFGSWQTLFSTMSVWGQDKVTFPIQVAWRYIKIFLLHPPISLKYWVAVVEFAAISLYVTTILWSWKKIRLSYWVFLAVSILIPSLTGSFAGMPRYGLHLYPMFLVLATWIEGASPAKRLLYIITALALLFFCITLFTRGEFIA